jgi:uncharacterized protein YjlB
MGNGTQIRFWKDCWLGSVPLCEKLPRLFSISMQKEETVARLRSLNGDEGWNFSWRQRLFVWETVLVEELIAALRSVVMSAVGDS